MIDAEAYALELLEKLDDVRASTSGDEVAILFLTNAVREVQLDALQSGQAAALEEPEVPKNQVGNFFEVEDGRVAFDVFPRE